MILTGSWQNIHEINSSFTAFEEMVFQEDQMVGTQQKFSVQLMTFLSMSLHVTSHSRTCSSVEFNSK